MDQIPYKWTHDRLATSHDPTLDARFRGNTTIQLFHYVITRDNVVHESFCQTAITVRSEEPVVAAHSAI